jgi:hypothetical protein
VATAPAAGDTAAEGSAVIVSAAIEPPVSNRRVINTVFGLVASPHENDSLGASAMGYIDYSSGDIVGVDPFTATRPVVFLHGELVGTFAGLQAPRGGTRALFDIVDPDWTPPRSSARSRATAELVRRCTCTST